jgi:predicted nucleic acid-binding protein
LTVYVDTSALLAILDADDANHEPASEVWRQLLADGRALVCNSAVLIESVALIQARLGLPALEAFRDAMLPILLVDWLDERSFSSAVNGVIDGQRRQVSVVDRSSFESARRFGVTDVLAFDRHFADEGFSCLPAPKP